MTKLVLSLSILLICSFVLKGQKLDKFQVKDDLALISGVEVAPNGKELAVAKIQGKPLYILNLETKETVAKIDLNDYYAGPKISYSKTGKYILLEQQFYHDWNENKDREVKFEVVSVHKRRIILTLKDVYDASISPLENEIVTISKGGAISVYSLPEGNKIANRIIEGAMNSVCYNADGKSFFVNHKLDKQDAASVPTIRSDKKAIKAAVKLQQGVSLYSSDNYKKIKFYKEVFDIVYDFELSTNNEKLITFSKLSTKAGGKPNQGNILFFDIELGTIDRGGFTTNLLMTDYSMSSDAKYIALINQDPRSFIPSVNLGDVETSDLIDVLNLSKDDNSGIRNKEFRGGQSSIDFSNDGKFIYVGNGNMIYKWEFEY